MGIDIGQAHWAYGSFHRFRTRLAEAEGIDLNQMEGFQRPIGECARNSWTNDAGEDITILRPFLDHSDCDGELSWQECEQVVDRLAEILNEWAKASESEFDHDVYEGRVLVTEMRACINHKEALEFW
ncbi:hypothetical protein PBI_PEREGRIN_17 [Rhodococcus phage Peregrin]|nr:hypothetical protein PBI_PEREGRIN_17 [Rhodococcus phage Peregrin]